MIAPSTLARIYAEVFKIWLDKNPGDKWGAKNAAKEAMIEFAETYKNNMHLWTK